MGERDTSTEASTAMSTDTSTGLDAATGMDQSLVVPYHEAFTVMPAPLVVLDAALRILDVNDAYLMMLSLQRERLVGRYLFEVFPASEEAAADAVTAESVLRAAIATGTSQYLPVFQYDTETEAGSGVFERRWWRMTATPLHGDALHDDALHGDVLHGGAAPSQAHQGTDDVVSGGEDGPTAQAVLYRLDEVTEAVLEQRRASAAEAAVVDLTGREARLIQVVESMASAFATVDHSGELTYLNAAFEQLAGIHRKGLMGQQLWQALPALAGTSAEDAVRGAVTTGRVTAFEVHLSAPVDGWWEGVVHPGDEQVAIYLRKVTDRHAAEQAAAAAAQEQRRSADQQAALVAIALALDEAHSQEQVLAVLTRQGVAMFGAQGGVLCLQASPGQQGRLSAAQSIAGVDGAGGGTLLRVMTSTFFNDQLRADIAELPTDYPLPMVDAAVKGDTFFFPDRASALALHPSAEQLYAEADTHAAAVLPLRAEGHLVGSLSLSFGTDRTWTPAEQDLMGAFAALTAQALERIAARDAERAATAAARASADQQAALVAVAQALGMAVDEADVLAVVDGQGLGLLDASGSGLCLRPPQDLEELHRQAPPEMVRILSTDAYSPEIRAQVQQLPADFPMPIVHTAVTGQAHFLADREQTAALFPGSLELYTAADVQASAAVPLLVGGQLLGSLSLGFPAPRAWPQPDQDLLVAFAALTAQALERIYARDAERAASAEVAQFSETLQRSLLTSPPEPDHLHIAVRYAPAAATAQVGGDWYDAFLTADSATTLVIGDVTGHDRMAAAAMGQLRNLLRGITYTSTQSPAAIVTALDHAARDLAVNTTATLVLARLEQTPAQHRAGQRVLRWSNAGHLPPLLIAPDGSTSYLEGDPNLILGIDPHTVRSDERVLLEAGSTVLLYTDGLVERRSAPLQEGLDWLLGAVADLAHLPVDELCDALLELVGGGLDDDVAMLALRAYPEDEPRPLEAGPNYDPRQAPSVTEGPGQMASPGTDTQH